MAELSVWTKVVNGWNNFFGSEVEGVEDPEEMDLDIPEVDVPEEQESKGFDNIFSRFNTKCIWYVYINVSLYYIILHSDIFLLELFYKCFIWSTDIGHNYGLTYSSYTEDRTNG